MHGPPVVFCERTGNWAAVWRRFEARLSRHASRPTSPRLIETRSVAECRDVLTGNHGAFVVAEFTPESLEPALELLLHTLVNVKDAATAVVSSRSLRPYQWLARELGAQAFVASPLEFAALRGLAERHLAKSPATYVDMRERIWKNLPWS